MLRNWIVYITKSALVLAFFLCNQQFAFAQLLEVDNESVVIPNPGIPIYPGFPDGHISYFRLNDSIMIHVWPGYESYITSGPDLFHQDSLCGIVLKKGNIGSYDNGGAWLYSVFPIDSAHWLGFYHAEDQEFPGYDNTMKIAWKSAAQCESFDGGKTWKKNGQFLTTWLKKPEKPTWGGTGDFSVIRDSANNRWLAYYVCPNGLGIAQSTDPLGRPGTWFKLNNGKFCSPGLQGKGDALPFSKGKFAGGNPSLIFYKPLKVWFMVYHDWKEQGIFYSFSYDLENWSSARLLLKNKGEPQRLWYPTLLSQNSDKFCNGQLNLAYAQWDDVNLPYRNYRIAKLKISGLTYPQLKSSPILTESALHISDTSRVTLSLFDATGRLLKIYFSETLLSPGIYNPDLHSYMGKGLNYLILKVDDDIQIKKLMQWE